MSQKWKKVPKKEKLMHSLKYSKKYHKLNSVKKVLKDAAQNKSTQKSILDFLCNAQKSELYWSQLTNIGGDIIPWLVS